MIISSRAKKILKILVLFVTPLVTLFVIVYSGKNAEEYTPAFQQAFTDTEELPAAPICHPIEAQKDDVSVDAAYDTLSLGARSAFVYDATARTVLFSKESEVVRPYASLTKVLTAATAISMIGRNAEVRLPASALLEGIPPFQAGEPWRVNELASLMLMRSSNDAARALATGVGRVFHEKYLRRNSSDYEATSLFFEAMNEKALQWHLDSVVKYGIRSVSGLDFEGNNASFAGNAREAAMLMLCAYEEYPDVVGQTQYEQFEYRALSGTMYRVDNTNLVVSELPGLIASKTGLTESAGGNLVVLYKAENAHVIAVVVLGSSKEQRFSDVRALVEATRSLFSNLES